MMSDSAKPIWQSKTIWGLIVAAVAMVLQQFFGISVGEEEQGTLVDMVLNAMEAVGLLLAAIGRFWATRPVVLSG